MFFCALSSSVITLFSHYKFIYPTVFIQIIIYNKKATQYNYASGCNAWFKNSTSGFKAISVAQIFLIASAPNICLLV
jgi:hypothetical protein